MGTESRFYSPNWPIKKTLLLLFALIAIIAVIAALSLVLLFPPQASDANALDSGKPFMLRLGAEEIGRGVITIKGCKVPVTKLRFYANHDYSVSRRASHVSWF